MKKNALTDEEFKTLLSARKILRRLTLKYRRWDDDACDRDTRKARKSRFRMEDWLDELYGKAYVDFCGDDAFIDIQPLRPAEAKNRSLRNKIRS